MVTPQEAVDCVRKEHLIGEILNEQDVMNPSKALVDQALKTWASKKMRADNTSVVTVILTPASSHNATSNSEHGVAAPQVQSVGRDPDMDVDLLLEAEAVTVAVEEDDVEMAVDSENSCPQEFFIEEEEYHLETPYSALAKRHLPPEPYRDFDYFGLDEDETEEDEESQPDAEERVEAVENWFKPRKTWRKSTINNSWNGATEPEPDPEPDERTRLDGATPDLTMYSHTSIDKCAIYGNSMAPGSANPELDQHLESSYSFAESYNSLLNEQEEQEARSRSAAAAAAVVQSQSSAQAAATCSVQEMIQEQQHYQQQEGYSLTQLETRRERERVAQESWQQPAELLELDALLQQERAEEEQVALEQQQQREQQMEVASSSSGQPEFHYAATEWSASLPEEVDGDIELDPELELEPEPELQDNEVSSTLPPTPTEEIAVPVEELNEVPEPQKPSRKPEIKSVPTKPQKPEKKQPSSQEQGLVSILAETVAEIRKEDAHAVHYIFEQIQKLQDADMSPVSDKPGVGEALERASVLAGESSAANVSVSNSNTRIRQMRRYRNVPNENHQHMQTRRRQIFKHSKPKSFIGASAAAIVAYGDSNGAGSGIGGSGGASSHPVEGRVGGGSVGGSGVDVATREINASAASRRRSGNVVASSSTTGPGTTSMMMTRRSHSLVASSGVNKRQLRSSLCSLGLGLGLDLTKRTLRTRNIPIATGGGETGRSQPDVPVVGNSAGPASVRTPSAGSTPRPVPSRRLKRIHEDREQRRSLRRTTLSASSSGSIGGGVGGGSVGPSPGSAKSSRLQSCNGAISARPPPSPKKLNAAVPTLAIGTRAYTAALAAAADHLNKRWSLRSSSSSSNSSNTQNTNNSNLITAISCYSARSRGAVVGATGATASPMGQPGGGGGGGGGGATRRR